MDGEKWIRAGDELPEPERWVDVLDKNNIRECCFYLCGCKHEWRDVLGYSVMINPEEKWRYSVKEKPDLLTFKK